MDEAIPFLIFLFIVIAQVVAAANKAKKKPPPPQRRPQARSSLQPRSTTEEISTRPRQAASVLLPEDLWKVLTGQMELPGTQPPPAKKPSWDVVYEPPEETTGVEGVSAEGASWDAHVELEATSAQDIERAHEQRHKQRVERPAPTPMVVDLETEPLPAGARDAAFHKRLAAQDAVVAAQAVPVRKRVAFSLAGRDLKHAFLVKEILGSPRGLE